MNIKIANTLFDDGTFSAMYKAGFISHKIFIYREIYLWIHAQLQTRNINKYQAVLEAEMKFKLPAILTELKLADSCSALTEPDAITVCAIKVLQGLDGDIKSAFLHNLSILIAQVAADGKLTWSDGVYILQWYYEHEYAATTTN